MSVTNIVSRYDRNLGRRRAQAPGPACTRIPQADADTSDADDVAGVVEAEASPLEHESGFYPMISK